MGDYRHVAILVTGMTAGENWVEKAHAKAEEIFHVPTGDYDGLEDGHVCEITPITEIAINSWASFMVAPDGSKIGWPSSKRGISARDEFVTWLRDTRGDQYQYLDWVEIRYGDYEGRTRVERSSDDDKNASDDEDY